MIKSPCKKVCKIVTRISNDERFCLGCGRTPYEIISTKNDGGVAPDFYYNIENLFL